VSTERNEILITYYTVNIIKKIITGITSVFNLSVLISTRQLPLNVHETFGSGTEFKSARLWQSWTYLNWKGLVRCSSNARIIFSLIHSTCDNEIATTSWLNVTKINYTDSTGHMRTQAIYW